MPWSVSQAELRDLLPKPRIGSNGLVEVTSGYFSITCKSLGGLTHELGFHFEPRRSDHLQELEFFRRSYPDLVASYREFQAHFENQFGAPLHELERRARSRLRREGQAGHEDRQQTDPHPALHHS